MTDAINNTHNRIKNSAIGSGRSATTATAKDRNSGASQPGATSAGEASTVEISNSTVIQQLSDQIDSLPEVNQGMVDKIKQSLLNGEYKPDAEVIARKFSQIEKMLS